MKKLITLFSLLLCVTFAFAQEEDSTEKNDKKIDYRYDQFKHWSIEAHYGLNKVDRPFAPGYFSATFPFKGKKDFNGNKTKPSFHADLGVRYMINTKFGLMVSGSYDKVTAGSHSKPFETSITSASLQGVVNLGTLLGFREWTDRFNLLGHGGMGFAQTKYASKYEYLYSGEKDWSTVFILGLQPQVRLTDWLALNVDLSIHGFVNQDYSMDGTGKIKNVVGNTNERGFTGMNTTLSAGLNIYLGDTKKKHADWFWFDPNAEIDDRFDDVEDRLAKLEEEVQKLKDNQFVLPEYLLQEKLDERYLNNNMNNPVTNLLKDGYVNVYFKFDKTDFEDWSVNWVHYVYKYMLDNKDAQIEIIGFTDELGSNAYNDRLSLARANKIKNILVALGINEGRLTVNGMGKDTSVDKKDADARKFMRRVNFKLKE